MFSSQILQNAEMNIGHFEENMNLSRIYLAVLYSKMSKVMNPNTYSVWTVNRYLIIIVFLFSENQMSEEGALQIV